MKKRLISLTMFVIMLCSIAVPTFAQSAYFFCDGGDCQRITTWTFNENSSTKRTQNYCSNCKRSQWFVTYSYASWYECDYCSNYDMIYSDYHTNCEVCHARLN